MIHEAYMPVYMGSRFLARDGTGRTEVVQEALADLKKQAKYAFLKLFFWAVQGLWVNFAIFGYFSHFPEELAPIISFPPGQLN